MHKKPVADAASLQGEAVIDPHGSVWLPYDLPHLRTPLDGWCRLSSRRDARHAERRPFQWRPPESNTLHVLNGMGVALGDSIIGMNVLAWLKKRHPALRIHLYRTPHAPAHVEQLYELVGHVVERVHHLPQPLESIPPDAIDLSDYLHWRLLATEPMVDMFTRGLGITPDAIPAADKANRWLSALQLPRLPAPWSARDYVLFCGQASNALRSMPAEQAASMVDRIWNRYGLPVLGFQRVSHAHYHDVSTHSPDLDHFMAWVRNASAVIGTDSSAIHLAAGFEVPTLAMFTSIDPMLRTRDYPHCQVLDLRTALTDGLHESGDAAVLREVQQIWRSVVTRSSLPWPVPRLSRRRQGQASYGADTGSREPAWA